MLRCWAWENLLPHTGKPYTESKEDKNSITRTFYSWVKPERLKWHMDDEDRLIRPTHKTNWQFQFENELPVPLDSPIFIKRHHWHRLIKGKGPLTLKITKNAQQTV
jgi:hypothetical protein